MKSTPLPRWLVLGNSAIVIGVSAVIEGVLLGIAANVWNPDDMLCGLVVLPLPLAVGSLQYAVGFRGKVDMARTLTVIHCCACVVFGVSSLLGIVSLFYRGVTCDDECVILLFMVIAFLYCGFCSWMHLRLEQYLRTTSGVEQAEDDSVGRFQFTLLELLAVSLVVAIIVSVAVSVFHS